jgi:GntR family transcriptional regulator, rspAB operon transcriptional repressor
MIEAVTETDPPAEGTDAPASATIRARLRRRLVELAYAPGEAISEKVLALEFGVSRTPVRDALLRLAEEKLVLVRPQRGTFAARIDLAAVRDAMVIRQALERVTVRAAAQAVGGGSRPDLQALLDLQAVHDAAEDLTRFHQADDAFHAAIATLGGHPSIWRVIKTEKAHVERCRALALPVAARRRTVMQQHRDVLRAISTGDPDAAEKAMAEHLADVLPNLAALRARHPDYFTN